MNPSSLKLLLVKELVIAKEVIHTGGMGLQSVPKPPSLRTDCGGNPPPSPTHTIKVFPWNSALFGREYFIDLNNLATVPG